MPVICRDKVGLGITRKEYGFKWTHNWRGDACLGRLMCTVDSEHRVVRNYLRLSVSLPYLHILSGTTVRSAQMA